MKFNRPTHSCISLIAIVVAAVAISSCGRKADTMYPWGWEKLGRPTDSLMVALQEAFLGDTSLDSCVILVNRFHEYADAPGAPEIEKARAVFWDARLAFATENYGQAHTLFRRALEATDSAHYPYDARYINLCLEPFEGKVLDGSSLDWEWYRRMVDDLDYSLKHDAALLGGVRAQYLSCIMTYSGNPNRALHYALTADSLFAGARREGDRLANRMNVASGRILTGDTVGALKEYAWIQCEIDRGVEPSSPLLLPLIDYNRWLVGNDTTALRRLRLQAKDNPLLVGYNAVASAYLAAMELEAGVTDSLTMRVRDMENGVDYTDDATQRALVLKMLGRACQALGRRAHALEYLSAAADVAEANVEALSGDKYAVAETERIINGIEQAHIARQRRAELRLWGYIAVCILAASVSGWFAYRYIKRLRRRRESESKKLDEAQRAELSMTLSIREKERQIEELRHKISSLADEEMIDAAAAREIESSIRSNEGASKADEEFGRVFTTVSPEFQSRLRAMYPRIGRNTLRMAEYIAIGMDNRHIARVMNIRPESVKQNRWRLRQALSLESDYNLDKILRDLL